MKSERRRQRSENPIKATQHLLTHTKEQRSYNALNVARASGECMAGAPSSLDNDALSIVAPLAGEGNHVDGGFLDLVTKGETLKVWKVPLEQDEVFLCAVGGPHEYPASTITAIKRILKGPSTLKNKSVETA